MSGSESLVELQREIYSFTQSNGLPVDQAMPWVLDRRNLQAAWERVSGADGAKTPGVDGLTAKDICARKDGWLAKLSSRLYRDTYRPSPPRWIDVPKGPSGAGVRRLGILTIEDRVVHAALKQVLEPILEPTFAPGSFGFRPGRSVPAALAEAARRLSGPHNADMPFRYVCKLDVANCFDTIDHAILENRLQQMVADDAVLQLLAKVTAAGGAWAGWLFRRRPVGLVQGSGLSPLLCNFYLDELDSQLDSLARRSDEGVFPLRYADDLLVLARNRRIALRAVRLARHTLSGLRQRLKASKSIVVPSLQGIRWLGVDIRPRQETWTDRVEFTYFVPKEKMSGMLERIDEMTTPPSNRIDPAAFDLGCWLASINEQLRDWWHAYVFAENAKAIFRKLDEHAFEQVADLLWAITGNRRRTLYQNYCVRLPRGFRTWRIDGAQLVVLSSLAPRNPAHLTRRPAWMSRARTMGSSLAVNTTPR